MPRPRQYTTDAERKAAWRAREQAKFDAAQDAGLLRERLAVAEGRLARAAELFREISDDVNAALRGRHECPATQALLKIAMRGARR